MSKVSDTFFNPFPNRTSSFLPQVVWEAVYYTMWVRRLRPEDQDVLVEFPRVERVVQRVPRVRPPQGFALSQARHQARKVHMLHTMLKVSQKRSLGQGDDVNVFEFTQRDVCFVLISEFPGLHVFPVGGLTAQLLRLSQRRTQPQTADPAAARPAHTRVPQHQQVHTHTNTYAILHDVHRCVSQKCVCVTNTF